MPEFLKNSVVYSFLSGVCICPFYGLDRSPGVAPVVLGKAASNKVFFKTVFLTCMVCRAGLVPSQVKSDWSFPSETHNKDRTSIAMYKTEMTKLVFPPVNSHLETCLIHKTNKGTFQYKLISQISWKRINFCVMILILLPAWLSF